MESAPLWTLIESTVRDCGLKLFDVELPKGRNGTLRIFLSVPQGSSEKNVTLDQCAAVSRKLDAAPEYESLLPEGCVVEVSSPGINRRLRLAEHFEGAVGERVKVKFGAETIAEKGLPGGVRVVRGKLEKFDGQMLEIDDEERHELVRMGLGQVREAQVDFLFDEV